MATLEKIRNRAGVLVAIVIGLALLAFILGDFLNSGGALFSNSQFEIAEISGKSISFQKYQKELNDLIEITKFSSGRNALDEQTTQRIQEQTWQQLLRKNILSDEYKELGIDISSQELWDMVQGDNIHPIIQNLFTNPETGQLNTLAVIRFLKTYDQDPTGQQKAYWLFLEDQMVQERKFTKYTNLIKKGLYVTEKEAQAELNKINKTVDFDFIAQNFNQIPDSLVNIAEEDLKSYYSQHENDFNQTASRSIEYVTFDVKPSENDRIAAETWINNIHQDFANTDNDQDFIGLNSDLPFDNKYYKKDELPDLIQEEMFNAEEGYIYGPYFEDETFKLAKLSDIKYLPDSVRARHILLQPTQQETDYSRLFTLADSLINLLKSGANFAQLSDQYSADQTANEKGGDLGWFRAEEMIKPFSDTCFNARVGEYKTIPTQYGLHITQVTDRGREVKKVQVATLGRKLEPSSETYQNIYAQASKFAGNNHTYKEFNQAIQENPALTKKIASNIKENDRNIPGLENPRELIRAIYNTELNEIIKSQNDPIFELGDRFVIGFVTDVKEEGIAPFKQVRSQILVQVKKEKKAEQLAEKINQQLAESDNINTLASKLNTEVKTASNISFRSYSVPEAGVEPKLIAVATTLDENRLSDPVKGNTGVYVVHVKSVNFTETSSIEMQQRQGMIQYSNRANYEAFEALKETANIVDKRAKFY
ncbi:MAG: SurA N-terminal domain-containing protein [Bacteroidales bacterium]|jgi:peptidyl-prolyl cis-trans isomerase D|nr:SurA N-terminal domain-containing protein [Bacteroidales bacterium]